RIPGCTRDDGSVGQGGLELTKDPGPDAEAERPSSAAVSLFAERSASHHRKRNASSCKRPSVLAMMGRKA
ncbi:hypothetical protein GUITHDRAFT_153083, partial [Guillardia theta CCMP2712]